MMRYKRIAWIAVLLLPAVALAGWLLFGRRQTEKVPAVAFPRSWAALIGQMSPAFKPLSTTLAEGESLSQVHCQVCHLRPEPGVLPLKSWLEVLNHHILIVTGQNVPDPAQLSLPTRALRDYRVPNGELAKVIYYYLASAPESLPEPNRPLTGTTDAPFKVVHAEAFDPARPAMYSLASILRQGTRIVLGEVIEKALVVLNANGEELHRIPVAGVATDIGEHAGGLMATLIGPQPYSTNDAAGQVLQLPTSVLDSAARASPTVLLPNLRRPVHTTAADLDGDGSDELLVEEFSVSDGSLGYYKQMPGGTFEHHVLVKLSGALSAYVVDFNHDHIPDVLGLISQATEGVFMFWGRGKGEFEQELLLQHQPAFGSNQLLIGDMNDDQFTDLVVINGDRMDLPSHPLVDYSGVHVYSNDGQNHFQEKFFYPLAGAVQAVVRDFDRDGDLDIVAVSATPDFSRQPLETAVYLENQGKMLFLPHRVPGAERGCWSVIASGDLNRDGYDDLVLGGAYLPIFAKEISQAFGAAAPNSMAILLNESTTKRDYSE